MISTLLGPKTPTRRNHHHHLAVIGTSHHTMDEDEGRKVNGIWQIVRLKEFVHKWQSITFSPSRNNPTSDKTHRGISPAINRRLINSQVCDSDEESCNSPEPPPDVPKGYLAVYVGPELRRFIIPTTYLSLPVFKVLLEKAEEEFGFEHKGGLTIPCEIETFKYLLKCMENKRKVQSDDNAGDPSILEEQ